MAVTRMENIGRMSDIVIHNGTIYLSGQVGDGDSVTAQTQSTLATIESQLEKANSSKSDLLSATIWLSDIAHFDEMNAVWDAWVDRDNPPARACGEAKLASPELLVEIIITAAQRA